MFFWITQTERDKKCIICDMANEWRARRSEEDQISQLRQAELNEQARFNAACAHGGPAILQTEAGLRLVWQVTEDWWYICGPDEATAPSIAGRNDATWSALMQQVGARRHPLFSKKNSARDDKRRG
jgi:hypothetical protein